MTDYDFECWIVCRIAAYTKTTDIDPDPKPGDYWPENTGGTRIKPQSWELLGASPVDKPIYSSTKTSAPPTVVELAKWAQEALDKTGTPGSELGKQWHVAPDQYFARHRWVNGGWVPVPVAEDPPFIAHAFRIQYWDSKIASPYFDPISVVVGGKPSPAWIATYWVMVQPSMKTQQVRQ